MTGQDLFATRASVYDALRPQDDAWWARFDAIVRLGGLRAARVLDVGCGTGALAAALAERAGARVWGIEPSGPMREIAQGRVPRGVRIRDGRAETLPFKENWFDGVVYSLVVHHVDRPRAFAEAARVLAPGGRVVVATFAHEHFATYWASAYFPSVARIDEERFPTEESLVAEFAGAGFGEPVVERISSRSTLGRDEALARIRGRNISTFDLLDEDELRAGTERAERELPEELDVRLEQLVVAACT